MLGREKLWPQGLAKGTIRVPKAPRKGGAFGGSWYTQRFVCGFRHTLDHVSSSILVCLVLVTCGNHWPWLNYYPVADYVGSATT
jgi:hypothetical protein